MDTVEKERHTDKKLLEINNIDSVNGTKKWIWKKIGGNKNGKDKIDWTQEKVNIFDVFLSFWLWHRPSFPLPIPQPEVSIRLNFRF